MAQPFSDTSRIMLRLLIDGGWASLTDTKARVGLLVPPGPAVRCFKVKEVSREERYGPRTRGELTLRTQIKYGRTTMVAHAYHSLSKAYLELRETPDGMQVRIKPGRLQYLTEERGITPLPAVPELPPTAAELAAQDQVAVDPPGEQSPVCPQCGLYIANQTQHTEFHESHSGPPAAAFFCEEQIRLLVAETVAGEVGLALDEFQAGLERYLEGWFTELTGARRRRRRRVDDPRLPEQLRV